MFIKGIAKFINNNYIIYNIMTIKEFGERMIPISITLKMSHIAILENKIIKEEIKSTSQYFRDLIERDNE